MQIKELTNPEYRCGIGGCPSIYKIEDKTPINACIIGSCPGIYSLQDSYIIIGKTLDKEKICSLGLESKIGADETIISVPKAIIDEKLE
jgi:hypothetical protein